MIYIVADLNFEKSPQDFSKDITQSLQDDVNKAVKTLGSEAIRTAQDLADRHLPPKLAKVYKDSIKIEEISENVVVVELSENAVWIEKGRKAGFMEDLLKTGAKQGKDGKKYRVIPIGEGKSNPQSSPKSEGLLNDLTSFLRSKNVTDKLATDKNGSPRTGKIHSFDIKKGLFDNIQRVSVFQNKNARTGKVEQKITAFRVISEKHRGTGKWVHPGRPPANILEQTFKSLEQILNTQIFPAIRDKYNLK
jgi:hypothetical protein